MTAQWWSLRCLAFSYFSSCPKVIPPSFYFLPVSLFLLPLFPAFLFSSSILLPFSHTSLPPACHPLVLSFSPSVLNYLSFSSYCFVIHLSLPSASDIYPHFSHLSPMSLQLCVLLISPHFIFFFSFCNMKMFTNLTLVVLSA